MCVCVCVCACVCVFMCVSVSRMGCHRPDRMTAVTKEIERGGGERRDAASREHTHSLSLRQGLEVLSVHVCVCVCYGVCACVCVRPCLSVSRRVAAMRV